MPDTSQERLHALDAVRGVALLLGVVFHATVSFLPGPHLWPIWELTDRRTSLTLAATFHILHIFRMSTFFLVAGFFAHMSLHKKGLNGFVRDRAKRIAVPLLVGWPILFVACRAIEIWGARVMAPGHPSPPLAFRALPAFPLTHLWFLYVLVLFYVVTLILWGTVAKIDPSERLRAAIDRAVRWLVQDPVGLLLLAAPIAATLYLSHHWIPWMGIMTPDNRLVPNAGAFLAFFTAFGLGFLLHRQIGLLEVWKRRWFLNLVLSVALSAAGLALVGVAPTLHVPPKDWRYALYALVHALSIWTWTFALIGAALRFLSGYSATRRYIADSSYWIYLAHMPLVMALQVAVAQWSWPWWMKFPLILAVAFPILFASYHLFVRYTFIGAVLNGRRERRSDGAVHPAQPLEATS